MQNAASSCSRNLSRQTPPGCNWQLADDFMATDSNQPIDHVDHHAYVIGNDPDDVANVRAIVAA
jgi:hypothetical protein